RLLSDGQTLSKVTDHLRCMLGVRSIILPMCDDRVETRVLTPQGEIPFQEFFVKERWAREVISVRFAGAEQSQPAPGVIEAIFHADLIIVCPSNPVTSVGPILTVPGIRAALIESTATVVGVSPIIGAKAISGPADKLLVASGSAASALGVAQFYADFLDILLIDDADQGWREPIESLGVRVVTTNIRMPDLGGKRRLARELLALVRK
ncbi:MAG TPA: 2-phospho-L-lactate transferase CofD family protein, partial [Candidatus Binatus sp.]|nr:2-phospho-L-lactate transferase CofD family protein [Candidatus Binatus sp.]